MSQTMASGEPTSAAPKSGLSPADLATFFLAGMVGIAAGNLTYLALMNPEHFLEPLRRILAPGLYAVWLLAGDANGYVTPDGWVPPLAVFLNAVAYAAGVMIPRLLWLHLTHTATRRASDPR